MLPRDEEPDGPVVAALANAAPPPASRPVTAIAAMVFVMRCRMSLTSSRVGVTQSTPSG